VKALPHPLHPIATRWGGGPLPEAVVEGFGVCGARLSIGQSARLNPSTTLRMVPLPTGCAGGEERD
jgi:hypothetical protein